MKLYYHPVSTTSRPVLLFIQENNLKVDTQVVDLMKGEHMQPQYSAMNPSKLVPMLEDGDFRLTESSAILKYLAEKAGSPSYPANDIKTRGKINEAMDWINANFYRDFGYGLIYPQIFPTHKRPSDQAQQATLDWAKEKAGNWLDILDKKIIGSRSHLVGDKLTIADYFGTAIFTTGELVGCDFKSYPNVKRWLDGMKQRPAYAKVFGPFNDFSKSLKGQTFAHV